VNLEPALRLGDALGGHWVQGHVDAVGEVVSIAVLGEHREVGFSLPEKLQPSVVEKGSITVDGVSLTVVDVGEDSFSVSLIPTTLADTILGTRQPGDRVNLEVDVVAKYVERMVAMRDRSSS
jgi:riboflavin synthase